MHKDEYEIMLTGLEGIDDADELARTLCEFGLTPNGDPRIEALIRRAMRGNGRNSRLLCAIYGETA